MLNNSVLPAHAPKNKRVYKLISKFQRPWLQNSSFATLSKAQTLLLSKYSVKVIKLGSVAPIMPC